ncbi:MAG: hypothetical protein H7338_03080 [Candidatus Sericytochromatia bacterium]|nr:hypothetical protein [Candidatus Sericytochromatia bacterium]
MSRFDRITLYGVLLFGLIIGFGCQGLLTPIKAGGGVIPAGHMRATIQVQMPTAKQETGFATKATNDLRNVTLPAKMRLKVTGLDIDTPIEPSGVYQNPIPLATSTATVSMIVPLGRNLIITAEGLTATGATIGSAVVKGVFTALVDQGSVTASANRLTTPVAEAFEWILAKQQLGPDQQKRCRNLMLSYDSGPLQQFVQTLLLGGTGNQTTDLQRLAEGRLVKHPGLVNSEAMATYVWERAAVPPNATFLTDAQGRGAFLTPGKVTGVVTGVRPGIPVTILSDDPVSKAVTIEGSQAFTLTSVRPGNWRVHAVASGYRAMVTHYNGTTTAPAFYAAATVAANGERINQDFTFEPLPAVVTTVLPGRGAISPSLTNPAFVTLNGQDFGDAQDGAAVIFQNETGGASIAANQVDSWVNGRIRVAVPALARGNYRVRIDRPTINAGEFVQGTGPARYAAGNWGLAYAPVAVTSAVFDPFTAQHLRVGIARNDDLHVYGNMLIGWDHGLRGYLPTQMNLSTGGVAPVTAFADVSTAAQLGATWAAHPDGRCLYIWSTGDALQARGFGISGTPLGAAYTLVPSSESNINGLATESAAFDDAGILHLAYLSKAPDVQRPVYRRFRINGLAVATPLGPAQRIDESTSGAGTQDAPRLRLGHGGHVAVLWVDRRTGVANHYFRVVKPDGTFGTPEVMRSAPVTDAAVNSQGEVALCSYNDVEQKLARYGTTGTLIGEQAAGRWQSGYHLVGHDGISRLVFDRDDHLVALNSTNWTQLASGEVLTVRDLYVTGYVPATTGYVSDSWRGAINVRNTAIGNVSVWTPVVSPLAIGPDGTLSLMFGQTGRYGVGGTVSLVQMGWF